MSVRSSRKLRPLKKPDAPLSACSTCIARSPHERRSNAAAWAASRAEQERRLARSLYWSLSELPTSATGVAFPQQPEKLKPVYAKPGQARIQALRMVWPIVCRRLESLPSINASQLFDELCVQFPGRFTPRQYKTLLQRVNLWRRDAQARGVVITSKTYRRHNDKPRGRRPDIFKGHWEEMARCLDERPDQTALELLVEFQARYPGQYSSRQLYTLQKRVRSWRQQAVQRLINDVASNILGEAAGNKIT